MCHLLISHQRQILVVFFSFSSPDNIHKQDFKSEPTECTFKMSLITNHILSPYTHRIRRNVRMSSYSSSTTVSNEMMMMMTGSRHCWRLIGMPNSLSNNK